MMNISNNTPDYHMCKNMPYDNQYTFYYMALFAYSGFLTLMVMTNKFIINILLISWIIILTPVVTYNKKDEICSHSLYSQILPLLIVLFSAFIGRIYIFIIDKIYNSNKEKGLWYNGVSHSHSPYNNNIICIALEQCNRCLCGKRNNSENYDEIELNQIVQKEFYQKSDEDAQDTNASKPLKKEASNNNNKCSNIISCSRVVTMFILLLLLIIMSIIDLNIPEKNILYKNYYIYFRFIASTIVYIFITLICIGFEMSNTTVLWLMISSTCISIHIIPFLFKYIILYDYLFYNLLIYIIIIIHGLVCATTWLIIGYTIKCFCVTNIIRHYFCCCFYQCCCIDCFRNKDEEEENREIMAVVI